MKKVLLAMLSVVAVNAATSTQIEIENKRSPITCWGTHADTYSTSKVCPPGPTRNHPKVMWDASTQEWLRYNKTTGEWDRMPTNQ